MTIKRIFSFNRAAVILMALFMLFTAAGCTEGGSKDKTAAPDRTSKPANTDGSSPAETDAPTDKPTDEPEATPLPAGADGKVAFYQLAPEEKSLMMSYVIKTPNGKIVVIDGGIDGHGLDKAPYLPAAIRAILGLQDGEYFEVEAWFLSHHHKDHFNELAKMLTAYKESDNYKINNFYFSFPEFGTEWKSSAGDKDHDMEKGLVLRNAFDHYYGIVKFEGVKGADIPPATEAEIENTEHYYYKAINGAVINDENIEKGLSIDVDGVSFRILQKWAKGNQVVNSTSTVIRMVYKDHSVLFLGDSYNDNAAKLLRNVGAENLKSEYVQMSHHGQGGPTKKFYTSIEAQDSIRLWPTPKWVWDVDKKGPYRTYETRAWMGLPEDFREFAEQGLDKTGKDIVTGLYTAFPAEPSSAASWTAEVLDVQRVAVWE